MARKSNLPGFMSEKEYSCPQCGNVERGNVILERVKACSYCAMSSAKFAEEHPEEYGIKKEDVAPHKLKGSTKDVRFCKRPGCNKPFKPTNNRQEVCPACRRAARNDRARLLEKEKRESATGI